MNAKFYVVSVQTSKMTWQCHGVLNLQRRTVVYSGFRRRFSLTWSCATGLRKKMKEDLFREIDQGKETYVDEQVSNAAREMISAWSKQPKKMNTLPCHGRTTLLEPMEETW